MATRDQIEELKQLTAGLEKVAKAEEAAAEAKEAYRNDPSEENKKAHRKAGQKLAEARSAVRQNRENSAAGGDASPAPATANAQVQE